MYIRSGHPRAFAHNPPNPTRFSRTRRPSFFQQGRAPEGGPEEIEEEDKEVREEEVWEEEEALELLLPDVGLELGVGVGVLLLLVAGGVVLGGLELIS